MKRLILVALLFTVLAVPPAVSAQNDGLLFQDPFTDNLNNWELNYKPNASFAIANGLLTLILREEGQLTYVSPNIKLPGDIEVGVEGRPVAPIVNTNYSFGLVLRGPRRYQPGYVFEVGGDGYWSIGVYAPSDPNTYKSLQDGSVKLDFGNFIRLKVRAIGDMFIFTINDVEVTRFRDSTYKPLKNNQYVGVEMSVGQTPGTVPRIQFKNFKVTSASAPPIAPSPTSTRSRFTPTPRPLLYQDRFGVGNPTKWALGPLPDAILTPGDNTLTIEVVKTMTFRWASPTMKIPADVDATVTVQVDKATPTGDWGYGIGIRGVMRDGKPTFYVFRVTGDGWWYFQIKQDNLTFKTIIEPTRIGGYDPRAANKLRLVATGSHFEFYLNGRRLGETDDDSLAPEADNMIFLAVSVNTKPITAKIAFSDLNVLVV